ncbi:MAG: hypothetical protein WD030_00805 [Pirellulales bacterium]
MRRRVVKLGGSLLQSEHLAERFARWRADQPPAIDVVIAGGGGLADAVRQYAARFALSDEAAHWRCVECMAVTARIVAELLNASLVDSLDAVPAAGQPRLVVFDAARFLATVEPSRVPALPRDWTVTSDSIAARVAEFLSADLVLLKSAPRPLSTWEAAAAAGYVDAYFPRAVLRLEHVSATCLP